MSNMIRTMLALLLTAIIVLCIYDVAFRDGAFFEFILRYFVSFIEKMIDLFERIGGNLGKYYDI